MAARRMAATSKGGIVLDASLALRQRFFFFAVTQQLIARFNPAVLIHAVLGGGWPRWQPLNGAVTPSYWRDASLRESWRAAMSTAAYSCNGEWQRLSLGWEEAGGGNGVAVQHSMVLDSKFSIVDSFLCFCLIFSSLFKVLVVIGQ